MYMLYDHCMTKINNTGNFVIANTKFLIIKLKSKTSKRLSVTFDFVFLTSQQTSPLITTQHYSTLSKEKEKQTVSLITQDGNCLLNVCIILLF